MSVTRISDWAHSASGESIELFHSSSVTLCELECPLLLIGGVHGDEPEGVRLADETLNWLKQREQTVHCPDWILIPCLNPNGFRKNHRCNGRGVDLNRNYPSLNWSMEFSKDRYNPGPKPASEPAVKKLVDLIKNIHPRLIIHFHSWNPCIVYAGDPGLKAAQLLGESSGYKVIPDIGYETPGSLSDFAWGDLKIPVICIEEQEDIDLEFVWPHFKEGLTRILNGEGLFDL